MGGQWPAMHLDWLQSLGITVVVNLTPNAYRDERFRIHQIPVPDWTAPHEEDIASFCDLLKRETEAGAKVYVHCLAGCGRTGTMLACYLIYRDRCEPTDAIARIRAMRPCSVETRGQVEAVVKWGFFMRAAGYELP